MAEEKDAGGSEVKSPIEPELVGHDVVVPAIASVPAEPVGWLRKTLKIFGPGLVTGAADDDPSGIATYSSVGAQFGYAMLWTMPLIYPFMAAIQEIIARLGRVTGRGIAGNIRHFYPAWIGVLGTLERKVRLSVCHDRILAAAARKPPLRSSTRQTIAFPEQDELTLAGYRSSMILPTSENGAIAR